MSLGAAGFHVRGGGDVGLSEDEDIGDTSVDILGANEGGPPLPDPPEPPEEPPFLPDMDCCMRQ